MILPPFEIGLTSVLPVLKVNVIAFPVAPASRSRSAIVNEADWTLLPMEPDETESDGSSSELSTTIPFEESVGAPIVTPFIVTVTLVAALIGVPPKVMVIEDVPNDDALENGFGTQTSVGVTPCAKKAGG